MGLSTWIFAIGPNALSPIKANISEPRFDNNEDCHSRESTLYEECENDLDVRQQLWKTRYGKNGAGSETMQVLFGVRSDLWSEPSYRKQKRILQQVHRYYKQINNAASITGIIEDYAGLALSLASQCGLHFLATSFLLQQMHFASQLAPGTVRKFPVWAVLLSFPGRLAIPKVSALARKGAYNALVFAETLVDKVWSRSRKFFNLWPKKSARKLSRHNALRRRSKQLDKSWIRGFFRVCKATIPASLGWVAAALLQNGLAMYLFNLSIGGRPKSLVEAIIEVGLTHTFAAEIATLTAVFYMLVSYLERQTESWLIERFKSAQESVLKRGQANVSAGLTRARMSPRVLLLERFLNAIAGSRNGASGDLAFSIHPATLQRPSLNTQSTPFSRQRYWQITEPVLPPLSTFGSISEFDVPARFFRDSFDDSIASEPHSSQHVHTSRAVQRASSAAPSAALTRDLIAAAGYGRPRQGFLVHSAFNLIRFMQRFFQQDMPNVMHPKEITLLKIHWSNLAFITLCGLLSCPPFQFIRFLTFHLMLNPLMSAGQYPASGTRFQFYKVALSNLPFRKSIMQVLVSLIRESFYTLLILEASWIGTIRVKRIIENEFKLFVQKRQYVLSDSC